MNVIKHLINSITGQQQIKRSDTTNPPLSNDIPLLRISFLQKRPKLATMISVKII